MLFVIVLYKLRRKMNRAAAPKKPTLFPQKVRKSRNTRKVTAHDRRGAAKDAVPYEGTDCVSRSFGASSSGI